MGLSVVNKLEIDDVNYHFARRISYVASTGSNEAAVSFTSPIAKNTRHCLLPQ